MTLVAEIMKRSVAYIAPEATLDQALQEFERQRSHYLMVSDPEGELGMLALTELSGLEDETLRQGRVRTHMRRPGVHLLPEMSVHQAARMFRQANLDCLPVCQGDQVLGYATICDVLDVLCGGVTPVSDEQASWERSDPEEEGAEKKSRWRIHPTMPNHTLAE